MQYWHALRNDRIHSCHSGARIPPDPLLYYQLGKSRYYGNARRSRNVSSRGANQFPARFPPVMHSLMIMLPQMIVVFILLPQSIDELAGFHTYSVVGHTVEDCDSGSKGVTHVASNRI